MKYKQEFNGIYEFKKNLPFIWKKQQEQLSGKYKIFKGFVKKEPITRDDYLDDYDYDYVDYVVIEDVETEKQITMPLSYFNRMFIKVEGK